MSKDFFPPSDSFPDVISKIVRVPPPNKVETKTHVIHLTPRVPAAKLAEYAVTDESRKEKIAKDSKIARIVMKAPYGRVRSCLPKAFSGKVFLPDVLLQKAVEIEASPARTPWYERDNKHSADALRRLALIIPRLNLKNISMVPRPSDGWGHLLISGVRVSVNPELVFRIENKGITKLGAVILTTGQAEAYSLAKGAEKQRVGDYLTSLLFRMLKENLMALGTPVHTKCFAIDIFRDQIYTAPTGHLSLNKHLTAACEMIALRWETIQAELPPDETPDEESQF